MSARRTSRFLAAGMLLSLTAAACGGSAVACDGPEDPANGMTINLPPALGGLRVQSEPDATKKLEKEAKGNTYLCGGDVFSLRKDKELRGVLQVGRLAPDARPEEKEFRKTVADGMHAGRAPELIGDTLVYKGEFNKQLIQLWFVDRFMLVLTVRASGTVAGAPQDVDLETLTAEILSVKPVPA